MTDHVEATCDGQCRPALTMNEDDAIRAALSQYFDSSRPAGYAASFRAGWDAGREWRQSAETAEALVDKLEHLLARAYPFLTWPDEVRGADVALDAEFDGIVTDVEVAIQHLSEEQEAEEIGEMLERRRQPENQR